jgi:hypothetical protein
MRGTAERPQSFRLLPSSRIMKVARLRANWLLTTHRALLAPQK